MRDVLLWSASTRARMPDPEIKFDSTFRLFSVLLTFSISASACRQKQLAGAGMTQAGSERSGAAGVGSPLPWRIPGRAGMLYGVTATTRESSVKDEGNSLRF